MKRKSVLAIALCAVLCIAFSVVAFAGDYDTPTIPICTNHKYVVQEVITAPTCTETGKTKYICTKCSKTKTETVAALGHLYKYNGRQSVHGVELICSSCSETQRMTAESLEALWNAEYINSPPARTVTNDSAYLDLDGNSIINAKDYAMIINLRHKELLLNSNGSGSITGNVTQEELP